MNVKFTKGDCGHFCEACARRDDKIAALGEALRLVSAGLKKGSIKSRPIIQFNADDEQANMQTLEEIVDAALAKAAP